jgi:micrococcal nuclease
MYEYKVEVIKVVDGDTIDVNIDLGFGMSYNKQRVRLMGIDTPESRTRDLEEKVYGKAAKKFLKQLLASGNVSLVSHDKGKFGRILGELFVKDNEGHPVFETNISVNQAMINNHHAVAYNGQSKEDIQEQHLKNREILNLV